ncbi:MAG: TniQ family protein [Rhodocyclales bacterium]|nr:TniQ family protein [Rhodocyclales bacterium]
MARIYGLTGRRLLVHPHPLPDELLTHWFMRLAHANGLKAQSLADYAFGHPSSFWARDQDRQPSPGVVERLAELTGFDPEEIQNLTLVGPNGIHRPDVTVSGFVAWVLPLGIYHRTRRRFGTQFCPLCLFEDAEPYFRRRWRLALATMCDWHGTMLHDRCPTCEAPVIWFRNELGHRRELAIGQSAKCWQCGFDLRRAPAIGPPAIDGQSIMALRSLVAFYDFGWWFVGDRSLPYAHLYFDVLRHLVAWLPDRRGRGLLARMAMRVGWPTEYPPAKAFEIRPILERHRLLAIAVWLLQEWPKRFVEVAKEVGLSQAHILRGVHLPHWFESEARCSLGAGFVAPSNEEVTNAVAYLQQQGKPVSVRALGQLVGSKEARVVLPYAARGRPPLTDEEFWRVIAEIDAEMRRCKQGSRKRFLLWRDRTMFIVMRVLRMKPCEVRVLAVADGMTLAEKGVFDGAMMRRLVARVKSYLRFAYPNLAQRSADGILFPSRARSGPMCPQAWQNRWNHACRSRWEHQKELLY